MLLINIKPGNGNSYGKNGLFYVIVYSPAKGKERRSIYEYMEVQIEQNNKQLPERAW